MRSVLFPGQQASAQMTGGFGSPVSPSVPTHNTAGAVPGGGLQFYSTEAAAPPAPGFARTSFDTASSTPMMMMGGGSNNMIGGAIGGQTSPTVGGSGTGFEDEPPLLEELGINFEHIQAKTLAVLNPLKPMERDVMVDTDMAGPLCFVLLMGFVLLFSGKVSFGYIYGVGLLGSVSIYALLNMMAEGTVDIYHTMSVLGYCLLPMVALAAVSVFFTLNSLFGYILSAGAISWCTYSSAKMFVTGLGMKEQRVLIAYPIALVYTSFALLTVF